MASELSERVARPVCAAQGLYYVVTGVWPVVHMPSFLAVTGPKVELWLVEMVGLLAGCLGVAFLLAFRLRELSTTIFSLAVLSALSFIAIDVVYFAKGRLPATYLADAAVNAVLLAAWMIARLARVRASAG